MTNRISDQKRNAANTRHPNHSIHPHERVTGFTTKKIPMVGPDATIGDVERILIEQAKKFESIQYIYIVDKQKQLRGVISIKDLFRKPKTMAVSDAMSHQIIFANEDMRRIHVAILALKHHLREIPVVDHRNRFVGTVTFDSLLTILHEEHLDSALRSAGIHHFHDPAISIINASAWTHFTKRFPWLFLGLIGGFIAAAIIETFGSSIQTHLVLAAFIPTIVYIADAAGMQTETLLIRSLSLDRFSKTKYLWRELRVGFFIAVILGLTISFYAWIRFDFFIIGWILGLSILITILGGMAIALVLPFIFLKLKTDPALASGPFGTVITDILSLFIYLTIAQTLIRMFPL